MSGKAWATRRARRRSPSADLFATAEAWAEKVLRPLIGSPMAPARWSTSTSPRCRRARSRASASSGRAYATMAASGSCSGPTRAASTITGSGWRRSSRRPATSPISRLWPTASSPSRRSTDLTHEGSLAELADRYPMMRGSTDLLTPRRRREPPWISLVAGGTGHRHAAVRPRGALVRARRTSRQS